MYSECLFLMFYNLLVHCQNSLISECPMGTYGEECTFNCSTNCRDECSQQTGHCNGGCSPGYTGDTCKTGKDFWVF